MEPAQFVLVLLSVLIMIIRVAPDARHAAGASGVCCVGNATIFSEMPKIWLSASVMQSCISSIGRTVVHVVNHQSDQTADAVSVMNTPKKFDPAMKFNPYLLLGMELSQSVISRIKLGAIYK